MHSHCFLFVVVERYGYAATIIVCVYIDVYIYIPGAYYYTLPLRMDLCPNSSLYICYIYVLYIFKQAFLFLQIKEKSERT